MRIKRYKGRPAESGERCPGRTKEIVGDMINKSDHRLDRVFAKALWNCGARLTCQSHEVPDGVTPVIALLLMGNKFGIFVFRSVLSKHYQATLFIEPHVCNSLFIKRPADHIAHECEHQEVNGSAEMLFHGRMLTRFCWLGQILIYTMKWSSKCEPNSTIGNFTLPTGIPPDISKQFRWRTVIYTILATPSTGLQKRQRHSQPVFLIQPQPLAKK